jgi:hypothetical protein
LSAALFTTRLAVEKVASSFLKTSRSYELANACGAQRNAVVPATVALSTGDWRLTCGLALVNEWCFPTTPVSDQASPLSSESMACTRQNSGPSG